MKNSVLHINCNYMGTVLHQKMIEHLDKFSDNTVFCPIHKKSVKATVPNDNVIVSECFKKLDRYFFFYKQGKIYRALKDQCDLSAFDIVHAYTLFTDGNVALSINKEYGIPYVVAIRNTDLYFFRKRINLRKKGIEILQNAAAVFFLAEPTKARLFDLYIPDAARQAIEAKSFIIPNGIDDFWLENAYTEKKIFDTEEKLKQKNLSIVCVAQIIKRKNIPVLQKAVQKFNDQGWKVTLDVIGKAVDQELLKQIAKDENTTYHAPVGKEDLISFYRKADIFALTSLSETFGLVYAEAMTQGLPVIYSKGQGFDGQFPDGTVGYAVNSSNEDEIAETIHKIAHNYSRISKTCLEMAPKFDWNGIVVQYEEIYQSLLK